MDIILKRKSKKFRGIRSFQIPPDAKAWGIHVPGRRKPVGFIAYATRYPDLFIYVVPKFRGRGLATQAEDLLAKREGMPGLIAFVSQENKASVRAHKKGGFEVIAKGETVPDGWKYFEFMKEYPQRRKKK